MGRKRSRRWCPCCKCQRVVLLTSRIAIYSEVDTWIDQAQPNCNILALGVIIGVLKLLVWGLGVLACTCMVIHAPSSCFQRIAIRRRRNLYLPDVASITYVTQNKKWNVYCHYIFIFSRILMPVDRGRAVSKWRSHPIALVALNEQNICE